MGKENGQFLDFISYARTFMNMYEYHITNERRWVLSKGHVWPQNIQDGEYVYVVLPRTGEVRFSEKPRPQSKISHPELCNGDDVIGAGLFYLRQGKIVKISNESGHYAPAGDSMMYVTRAFRQWSMPVIDKPEIDSRWEVFGNM